MTTPILTAARLSLWAAIDNWPDLANPAFRSKWKFETDIGQYWERIDKAGIADLPAIGIQPLAVQPQWVLNEMMEFTDAYTIDIRATKLSTCEDLVQKVWQAIYRSAAVATPTVSYVKAATGYHPKVMGPIQRAAIGMGEGGKLRVWQFQLTVALRLRQDPFAAS